MNELKPCPFCGGKSFSYRFKKDNRIVFGVRHEICTIECLGCTASVRQAGPTREEAEENVAYIWNRRLIEDNRCGKCRWHSEDHLFCENPNSDFYGWFRNDWKRCDKYEEQEAQE